MTEVCSSVFTKLRFKRTTAVSKIFCVPYHNRSADDVALTMTSFFALRARKPLHNEAVFCLEAKKPLHTGVRTGCHYLLSLSVLCVSVCVTFVVFTDCESCTRPIFTNPESMETGECGLTRGTFCAARRLKVVAIAGRL